MPAAFSTSSSLSTKCRPSRAARRRPDRGLAGPHHADEHDRSAGERGRQLVLLRLPRWRGRGGHSGPSKVAGVEPLGEGKVNPASLSGLRRILIAPHNGGTRFDAAPWNFMPTLIRLFVVPARHRRARLCRHASRSPSWSIRARRTSPSRFRRASWRRRSQPIDLNNLPAPVNVVPKDSSSGAASAASAAAPAVTAASDEPSIDTERFGSQRSGRQDGRHRRRMMAAGGGII